MEATDKLTISGILKKLPVFAGLYPEEYEHIRDICIPANFPADQVVFHEGDGSPCMYVLLAGDIELETKGLGTIYHLKPGDIFGEIGLISQKKRTATATTRSASTLLKINGDALQLLLGREPRISYAIMRNITLNLSQHIIRMNNTGVLDYIPQDGPGKHSGLRRVNRG
jgi:CRP-like cAMP-binding protein